MQPLPWEDFDATPSRIQIACDGKLVAEVIGQYWYVYRLWAAWAKQRYAANKHVGGAMINRIDIPRYWDVAVGERIEK